MTGPFSLVSYMPSFGPQAYFVNIPSKFMGDATYPSSPVNAARRVAVPGPAAAAAGTGRLDADPSAPLLAQAAAAGAARAANLSRVAKPLAADDVPAAAAAALYPFFLSYSANFASGYSPNPEGSGYHWSLQASRFTLSAAFAERLAAKQAA